MASKKTSKSAFESMMFTWGEPLDAKTAGDVFDITKNEAYEYFKEHAYQLKLGFNPRINYLDVVDILIEKANNNLG